jgi:hypothetical protein
MGYPKLRFKSKMSIGRGGYLAALILTEKPERERGDIILEALPVWRDVIRVSEGVVKRKGSN